jgi:hypothetical protein
MKYQTIADDVQANQKKFTEVKTQEKEIILINQWEKEKKYEKVQKEYSKKLKFAESHVRAKSNMLNPLERREMDMIS